MGLFSYIVWFKEIDLFPPSFLWNGIFYLILLYYLYLFICLINLLAKNLAFPFPPAFLWKVISMVIPCDWLTANFHDRGTRVIYSFCGKRSLYLSPVLPPSLSPPHSFSFHFFSFPHLLSASVFKNGVRESTRRYWVKNQGPIPMPISVKEIKQDKGKLGRLKKWV